MDSEECSRTLAAPSCAWPALAFFHSRWEPLRSNGEHIQSGTSEKNLHELQLFSTGNRQPSSTGNCLAQASIQHFTNTSRRTNWCCDSERIVNTETGISTAHSGRPLEGAAGIAQRQQVAPCCIALNTMVNKKSLNHQRKMRLT